MANAESLPILIIPFASQSLSQENISGKINTPASQVCYCEERFLQPKYTKNKGYKIMGVLWAGISCLEFVCMCVYICVCLTVCTSYSSLFSQELHTTCGLAGQFQ